MEASRCSLPLTWCFVLVIVSTMLLGSSGVVGATRSDSQRLSQQHRGGDNDVGVCTTNHNCIEKCEDDEINTDIITWLGSNEQRLAEFQDNMMEAENFILSNPGVKSVDGLVGLHMTLAYVCCLNPNQLLQLEEALTTFVWDSSLVNVTFSRAVCNNDSYDHTSFIVLLDELSQQRIGNFVLQIEQLLEYYGVPITRPRSEMEPFHSTLGVVVEDYPVAQVLNDINGAITVWNSQPIAIKSFFTVFPPGVYNATSSKSL
eukprot:TRINITY_DN3206_c0_g1_i1.p1 TRINITY_DN3206_c0_g1~~TRINITY_DN3206_c0_g1_i1.p1  ORF type:complete len:275 (+),score=60.23 TRINITY_DN3206_c0_g1_i1:50-826(+)